MRQLPKADLIIDYEVKCIHQLCRFGFNGILYGDNDGDDDNNSSSLGKILLG